MSIAFLDPGNLEGDLQAGVIAGYSLLWLLMWATAIGLLVQLLSARLGVATRRHLAELCCTLIGSCSFIFLFLENYGVRKLEALFAVLIGVMTPSFAWMFGEANPDGLDILLGLLVPKPSSRTIQQAVAVEMTYECPKHQHQQTYDIEELTAGIESHSPVKTSIGIRFQKQTNTHNGPRILNLVDELQDSTPIKASARQARRTKAFQCKNSKPSGVIVCGINLIILGTEVGPW
ncbi:hypothetical protein K1719_018737 [Acacia pycnantha]|nr:hypothetical protein K1719_018737 [Acacia pycnantha]